MDEVERIQMGIKREKDMTASIKSMIDYKIIDHLKIFQTILLRRLQPEQFNAVINTMYATRPSATSQEFETALVNRFSIT